ncbi:arginine-binding periplasmic protein [Legionella lansingensis]|uniref:Arginine-binding periplasmic protein n=1 Tax=Legionella lansingensis TaxID=45067 RepID=A0A0W0VLB2_9GAMM|nr:transporter substrate-binding domain-containing protein [Legionella lansingensis]KTD20914.1 arginine-binding periplasmic protein [Legionella lansingensis]SNV44219.1 arginine-binding periplasmic protein [Legionella lansingensis]
MKQFRTALLAFFLSLYLPSTYADIKVGTVFFDPPFVTSMNQGFDVELILLLCQKINTPCQLMPMDFNKLFPALDNGTIDLAIGGIVISEARLKKYIFTLPYMLSKGQFLISNKSTLQTLNDLAREKVGVLKGEQDSSVFANYLNQNFPGQFTIIDFDDIEDLVNALSTGNIAAAFIHESTALYWQQNGGGQFKLLGTPTIVGEGIAIMTLPQNNQLVQQLNAQLQAIEKDGSYLNLYQTYFGQEQ